MFGIRFKHLKDPFKLVIVRDPAGAGMTRFDAPCLHSMYADKPMSGHNLMQAIARVWPATRECRVSSGR